MKNVLRFAKIGVLESNLKTVLHYQTTICKIKYEKKSINISFTDPVYFYSNSFLDDINMFMQFNSTDIAKFCINHYKNKTKVSKIGSKFKYTLTSMKVMLKPEDIKNEKERENYYINKHYTLVRFFQTQISI